MKIIMKKILRGLVIGAGAAALTYAVCFLIELFTFLREHKGAVEAGSNLTAENYSPVVPVWSTMTILLIVGIALFVGALIGFIVGCVYWTANKEKIADERLAENGEGEVRQKRRYASSVKTMAESLGESCDETLFYMKNIIDVDYTADKKINDIMAELVKFTGYERDIKDMISDDNTNF